MKDPSPFELSHRRSAERGRVAFASRRSFYRALIAGGLAFLTSGCVESSVEGPTLTGPEPLEIHAEKSGMALSVALDGDAVIRGENLFLVQLGDDRATLTAASAVMPGHGHDTASPSIERDETTYRVSGLLLFMPGRWEVTLELDVDGASDHAVFSVDVP